MYKVTLTKSIRKPNKAKDIEGWLDWNEGYKTASIEVEIPKDEAITMASYITNKLAEKEEKGYNMAMNLLENGTPGQKKFARMALAQFGEGDNMPEADSGSELQTRGKHLI